ncbi:MAG: fumarylacetoacetate hydrolase family protein [Chitinophagaceae bacterium]
MSIYCIGRNYVAHIEELKNEIPSSPVIFSKPISSILPKGQAFEYPTFTKDIHYECELVLRIGKSGKATTLEEANTFYDAYTLGIDFTARDLQQRLKEKGLPWDIAKGFDGAAILGDWKTFEDKKKPFAFSFYQNDILKQEGNSELMIYSFEQMICELSVYFTLQKDDILFTGTPHGVGPIAKGDVLQGFIENESLFLVHVI